MHGVSGDSGSHLGSTLNPGGAVLTLGVSRRSRSVAYIRADASPSEVHVTCLLNHRDSTLSSRQCNSQQTVGKVRTGGKPGPAAGDQLTAPI
ncbi:MAG: hypothetical protein QOD88_4194 [Mycobacterium sp.]|nr:hypothetical protein [Mycobacterium sp.]